MSEPRSPQEPPSSLPADEAVQELRSEVDELRHELDRREVWKGRRRRLRRVGAGVCIVLFSVCLVATTVGTWARTTLLDTDKFVATVGPVVDDAAVNAALAAFLTNEVFSVVEVQQRAEDALPDDIAFLAAPLTEAVESFVEDRVATFLDSEAFERVWRGILQNSHNIAADVLSGDTDAATTSNGEVVLDLLPVVNEVLQQVSSDLPEIFGQQVSFPDITDESTQQEIRDGIENALGVDLPEDFGQIAVFDENKLSEAQDAIQLMNRFVLALVVLTVVFLGAAIALSVDRRRTLLQVGVATAVTTFLVFTVLRRVIADLIELVPEGQNREAVRAIARIVADGLRERAWVVLVAGFVVAAAMYLAGPGRGAAWVRRSAVALAGQVRERGAEVPATPVGHWVHQNLDALRIGGLAAGALLLVVTTLSWFTLFVVLVLVAAFEGGVTAIARRAAPEPAS